MKNKLIYSLLALFFSLSKLTAQDDLLSLVEDDAPVNDRVEATFKTTRLINAQSTESVKSNALDFRITHRFGSIGTGSNGGVHTLYGLDVAENIRFSFDYGISDKLTVGVGRSKRFELLDGSIKYRFLEQTKDNKVPISIALYSIAGLNPQKEAIFYAAADPTTPQKFAHRLSYATQLIIARKFGSRLSLALIPSYVHRNFVIASINVDNNATEENGLLSMGVGGRVKVSKRVAILADYFYTLSDFRKNNPNNPYYMPLAIGVEIETGGHVFHIDFTNVPGIAENDFIPYSPDSWQAGGYKFGFNISRVFTF